MALNYKKFIFLNIVCSLVGCGVKGVPLPPLTQPPIGRGEPIYTGKENQNFKNEAILNQKAEEADDDDDESSTSSH